MVKRKAVSRKELSALDWAVLTKQIPQSREIPQSRLKKKSPTRQVRQQATAEAS